MCRSNRFRICSSGFGRGSRYSLCRTSKRAFTNAVMLIWLGPDAQGYTQAVGDDSAARGRLLRHSSLNKRTLLQFIGAGAANGAIKAQTQSATAPLALESAVFHVSARMLTQVGHKSPTCVKKRGDVQNKHHRTQISACFLVVWGHNLPSA